VGDPLGAAPARIELGVSTCDALLMGSDDKEEFEDGIVLGLRVRATRAIRWEWGPSGGVDSGILGLWNADDVITREAGFDGDLAPGFQDLQGHVVLACSTGDGVFPCVLGYDDAHEEREEPVAARRRTRA
jgi:hypothetical protein